MNSNISRNAFVYLLILVAAVALFLSISPGKQQGPGEMDITAVAAAVNQGNVRSIAVDGADLTVKLNNDEVYVSRKDENISLLETLQGLGVQEDKLRSFQYEVKAPSQSGNWLALLGSILPLILVGALFLFLMRQAQGSNSQAMSFGKSKAKMLTGDKPTVTFEDVAGCDEAKQELSEIVEFLREPQKFAALGARIPKGVLMVGHPGTGKTLMAKQWPARRACHSSPSPVRNL